MALHINGFKKRRPDGAPWQVPSRGAERGKYAGGLTVPRRP
jgi:hypothetical protein